jgi:bifunctional ADP-heptose synthase (sugar kinase/adenylyltransferase)
VLAGLAAVDRVVLFDDPTPLALIESLAPDVLAKGADYTRETVVGADFVESRGGRVALIPLVPHQSTTSLAERIRGSS